MDSSYLEKMRSDPQMFVYAGLPSWQLEIIHKYPDIYLTPNPYVIERLHLANDYESQKHPQFCNLRFGFEFREGWKALLEEFSEFTLQFVIMVKESGVQSDAYVRAFIFKQKFNRLVWQGSDNLIEPFHTVYWTHVEEFGNRSIKICEITGQPR
jgi:hypothetical protein